MLLTNASAYFGGRNFRQEDGTDTQPDSGTRTDEQTAGYMRYTQIQA